MDLIEIYANEVGQHLPENTRADIQQEIRSMIEDTLEDEARQLGRPANEAMLLALLKRLGSPQKMAASYLPKRYLIGPALYPTFILVARVVVTVMLVLGLIGLGISLGMSDLVSVQVGRVIFEAANGLLQTVVSALGWVVLGFAIAERVSHGKGLELKEQEWNPESLKKGSTNHEDDAYNRPNLVAEVVVTIIALVIFNAFGQSLGIGNLQNGRWTIIPILSPVFFTYLPWITLIWGLKAAVDVLALARGRWSDGLLWALSAISLGSFVLGLRMITGPDLASLPTDIALPLDWGASFLGGAMTLESFINLIIEGGIGIALIVESIELATRVYRLVARLLRSSNISYQG